LPGDIHVVAWDPRDPARAYALEAKGLKVSGSAFSTGRIGGAGKLTRAEAQVRGLASIGFHSVALLVFLLVDVHTVAPGQWLSSAPAGILRGIREELDLLECATLF
jgi:hypothetical protein